MSDRVGIGTVPGGVAALVGTDVALGALGRTETAVRIVLRRTGQTGGDVVTADLRNATGGGGDAIPIAFAAGAGEASATGAISGSAFYLRVTASDANSQDLSGWLELVSAAGVATALTNLARVKNFGVMGNLSDALLNEIIAGVSQRMQRYIGRSIVEQTLSDERHDGDGRSDKLILRVWPVTAVTEVRIAGVALGSAEYEIDEPAGILYRRTATDAFSSTVWDYGRRIMGVDYTGGYATLPEDLVEKATEQVCFTFKQSKPGGNRLGDRGTVLDPGGSAEYLTGSWAPGVLDTLESWRTRAIR